MGRAQQQRLALSQWKWQVGWICMGIFVAMSGVGAVAPFLSLYAKALGAGGVMVGLVFAGFSLSRAVVVPVVGAASDRLGRKGFLLTGLAGYGACALMLMAATSPWELLGNRLAQGVFAAMVVPVGMAMVAELAPRGVEGRVMGAANTAVLMGFGVGPLVGGAAYDAGGIKANFLIMCSASLLALGVVALAVREQRAPIATLKGGWNQLARLVRDRMMAGVLAARASQAAAMGTILAFLPILGQAKGISATHVGLALMVEVLSMVAVQAPAGWLADRFQRLWLAAGGQLVSAVCKGLMAFAPGPGALVALAAVEGLGAGVGLPALTAMAVARGKDMAAGMGVTMGGLTVAMSAGVVFGPVAGGALANLWGAQAPIVMGAAVAVGGVGLLVALGRPLPHGI